MARETHPLPPPLYAHLRLVAQSLELHLAIDAYLAAHNRSPKPFIWTAKASDILAKAQRARAP